MNSRGKNVQRIGRLAESAERVITSQRCVKSVDERKKLVNAVSVSSSDSGESLFTIQKSTSARDTEQHPIKDYCDHEIKGRT